MSLNMSFNNEYSSSSGGENSVPKFPDRKEDFEDWKMVMTAYLDARGLLEVVTNVTIQISKSTSSSSSGKDDTDTKSTKSSTPISSTTDDDKRKRAHSLLLSSFKKKQLALAKQVQAGDAAALWKKINDVYGII